MVKKIPAIIPARGGSKGIPGKNLVDLCGKPLIAWAIEAALGSKYLSDIIVSTDSERIAKVAKNYGASVPFMRPANLAADHSIAIDTYLFTVEKLNEFNEEQIQDFIVLQPTSPLRKSRHIDEAIKLYFEREADSVISFYENPHPTHWLRIINEEGYLRNYESMTELKNRQDYKRTYLPNGAILILQYEYLKKYRTYYFDKTIPYLMTKNESVDIDDYDDLLYTKFLIERK